MSHLQADLEQAEIYLREANDKVADLRAKGLLTLEDEAALTDMDIDVAASEGRARVCLALGDWMAVEASR